MCEPEVSLQGSAVNFLGDAESREALVAGGYAFIHRQQAFVTAEHDARDRDEVLHRHAVVPHFQFLISGMSIPYLAMWILCSISLSFILCFR